MSCAFWVADRPGSHADEPTPFLRLKEMLPAPAWNEGATVVGPSFRGKERLWTYQASSGSGSVWKLLRCTDTVCDSETIGCDDPDISPVSLAVDRKTGWLYVSGQRVQSGKAILAKLEGLTWKCDDLPTHKENLEDLRVVVDGESVLRIAYIEKGVLKVGTKRALKWETSEVTRMVGQLTSFESSGPNLELVFLRHPSAGQAGIRTHARGRPGHWSFFVIPIVGRIGEEYFSSGVGASGVIGTCGCAARERPIKGTRTGDRQAGVAPANQLQLVINGSVRVDRPWVGSCVRCVACPFSEKEVQVLWQARATDLSKDEISILNHVMIDFSKLTVTVPLPQRIGEGRIVGTNFVQTAQNACTAAVIMRGENSEEKLFDATFTPPK